MRVRIGIDINENDKNKYWWNHFLENIKGDCHEIGFCATQGFEYECSVYGSVFSIDVEEDQISEVTLYEDAIND